METKIEFIDTHAHIYDEKLVREIDLVIEEARSVGVSSIYMPNINSTTIEAMLDLENRYPEAIAMMGLHPCDVKGDYQAELSTVKEWLIRRPFAAVGEIGIDLYWDKSYVDQQLDAYYTQVEWAKELKLPFVIHSRDSLLWTIKGVKDRQDGTLRGIFHCFSGSLEEAKEIIDLGFYLGIGGVVTFKNGGLDKVIKDIDLEHLVLETDSPYLTPTPFRGKTNKPQYLVEIAQKIAEVKGVSLETVAAITTNNAKKIFSKTPKKVD